MKPLYPAFGFLAGCLFSICLLFVAFGYYGGAGHGPRLPEILATAPVNIGPVMWPLIFAMAFTTGKRSKYILVALLAFQFIGTASAILFSGALSQEIPDPELFVLTVISYLCVLSFLWYKAIMRLKPRSGRQQNAE